MPLPNVNITLQNGQLGGVLQTADGIAGMVLTGATYGTITVGTPNLITSLTDAENQGLNSTNNAFAYRQVKEFYDEAGVGAQLYLMLVDNTNKVDHIADKTNANGAITLLNYAAGKIRILGVMTDDTAVYPSGTGLSVTHAINNDCYTAIANMQNLANQYFNAQTPFRAVIGGTSYDGSTGLTLETNSAYNRVSVLIGDTQVSKGAALGLFLGRLATIPVQRKVSRVRTGPLTNTAAFIGSTSADVSPNVSIIADAGYITFRTFPNKNGYYFSGDPTCTATTDDYNSLARGRVIDKAQILAYATFVNEVDDEVSVTSDGKIDPGYAKWLESQIENQINLTMTANQEVSGVSCFIDTNQNILSTNILNVVLKVTPVGYASDIEVQLGFDNPALNN